MAKKEIENCIEKLLKWVPEGVPLEKISRQNYPVSVFGKVFFKGDGEHKGDDEQPFFSEAYLYNLLGKEDARTLLALMRQLCVSLKVKNNL